jgi:hypothetical protein
VLTVRGIRKCSALLATCVLGQIYRTINAKIAHAMAKKIAVAATARVTLSCSISIRLNNIEALSVDVLGCNAQLGQAFLHRVHHGEWTADEILESPVLFRKMPAEQVRINESSLARPILRSMFESYLRSHSFVRLTGLLCSTSLRQIHRESLRRKSVHGRGGAQRFRRHNLCVLVVPLLYPVHLPVSLGQ